MDRVARRGQSSVRSRATSRSLAVPPFRGAPRLRVSSYPLEARRNRTGRRRGGALPSADRFRAFVGAAERNRRRRVLVHLPGSVRQLVRLLAEGLQKESSAVRLRRHLPALQSRRSPPGRSRPSCVRPLSGGLVGRISTAESGEGASSAMQSARELTAPVPTLVAGPIVPRSAAISTQLVRYVPRCGPAPARASTEAFRPHACRRRTVLTASMSAVLPATFWTRPSDVRHEATVTELDSVGRHHLI